MSEEGSLEKLKKRLYKKEESFSLRLAREQWRAEKDKILPYWKKKTENKEPFKKNIFNPIKIMIYLSIVLTLIVGGFFAYLLRSGSNTVSSSNIAIEVSGPAYVDGGQPIKLNYAIMNKNASQLELADIIFNFPENTFSTEGDSLSRTRISLGDIAAGETVNKSIDLVFFGSEGEEKRVDASLEYRFSDSNAIFVKEKEYAVKITKAPLGMSLFLPKEITSGQEIKMKVEIISNSESVAKNLKLEMKYPPGFRFLEADPEPRQGNNIWSLGDLGPNQKSSIEITGAVEGQNFEERIFVASVGSTAESGELISYGSASEKTVIKKSPLNLSVFINGNDEDKAVVYPTDSVRVELEWVNNLLSNIRNAQLEMEISGEVYDPRTLSVSKGFLRTQDDAIIWNAATLKDLADIAPGETNKAQLSFYLKKPLPVYEANDKDFTLKINARILGMGTSDEYENKEISDSVEKEIYVGSIIQTVGRALYYSGDFKNSGPVPPEAGSETTYTIVWSLANNINDISGVKITSSLPPYVTLGDSQNISESDLQFDEKTGNLVWNVGDVAAGTGLISPAKEISFQVALTPSVAQIGNEPILINVAKVEGKDVFTDRDISAEIPALTTRLSADPQSKIGDGTVKE